MNNLSLFDGSGDDEGDAKDVRTLTLLQRVYVIMSDGHWRSLSDIREASRAGTEASVSARLRDLRKPRFGGHTVERRHAVGGLYAYRLIPSEHGLLDGSGERSRKPEARRILRDWLDPSSFVHIDKVRWAVEEMLR